VRLAFVPSAPLLLPALGGGPEELRSACHQAISVLGHDIVVLGGASPAGWRTGTVDATPWGAPGVAAAEPLPLPLAVGSALLGDRPHRLLAVDGTAVVLPPDSSVLVVGDGTARRTEKAPGHYDPRAEPLDTQVAEALRDGRPEGLLVDEVLAAELLVAGAAVWRTVAATVAEPVSAELLYAAAPFGVGYVVATWIGS
jgi:hypothetical protein